MHHGFRGQNMTPKVRCILTPRVRCKVHSRLYVVKNDHTVSDCVQTTADSLTPSHRCFKGTGCPRMFYTVFQKNIKNIKSTMSLIMIVVIEFLICDLPTVKISFTYLYPLRCDMVSLKIDE